ncbi:MAG: DUF5752 family protein [Candidatus Bathyarchaeia archaeon]|jgi:hypothetical protein
MSESKIRGKILIRLWVKAKPMTLQEISEKVGLDPSSILDYLFGLINADYVCVPTENCYELTSLGKQAIGMPKMDQTLAATILQTVPIEKAFQFYNGLDQNTGIYADSLESFIEKIQTIENQSIEFHIPRKDFECWINSTLGDVELSKRMELIRSMNLTGENLRNEVYHAAKARYEELIKILL